MLSGVFFFSFFILRFLLCVIHWLSSAQPRWLRYQFEFPKHELNALRADSILQVQAITARLFVFLQPRRGGLFVALHANKVFSSVGATCLFVKQCSHRSHQVAPTELLGCFNSISTNRPPLWGYIRSSPAGIDFAFHTQINNNYPISLSSEYLYQHYPANPLK